MTDQEIAEMRERLVRIEKLLRHGTEFYTGASALVAGAAFFYVAKDGWKIGETGAWIVATIAAIASFIYSDKRYRS